MHPIDHTGIFYLFAGERYYPSGGVRDFVGFFSHYDSALSRATNYANGYDWWHITDSELRIVMNNYEYELQKENINA